MVLLLTIEHSLQDFGFNLGQERRSAFANTTVANAKDHHQQQTISTNNTTTSSSSVVYHSTAHNAKRETIQPVSSLWGCRVPDYKSELAKT